MSNRDVAFLSFKLLGLWLIASAITGAAGLPYVWQSTPAELRGGTLAVLFLPSLVALGLGLPLWLSADWFAGRVFARGYASLEARQRPQWQPLFALGASLIGLCLLTEGVPALSSAIYLFGRSLQTGVLGPDEARERLVWDASAKANALGGVVRFLIGLALLAGPARLAATVAGIGREFSAPLVEDEDQGKPHRGSGDGVEQGAEADKA